MSREPQKPKRPRIAGQPPTEGRTPRVDPNVLPDDRQKPVWRVGKMRIKGYCCWENTTGEMGLGIRDKLASFETMTWQEMQVAGSHDVEVTSLCKEAQAELRRLGLGDVDSLASLRLSGRQRAWALRNGSMFSLLWWDPEHQICPSEKRNT